MQTDSSSQLLPQQNALALEYQSDYRSARRNIDITNPVDQPFLKGEGRVFGPGFLEEIDCLLDR
jgi:hypothetical protein